MNNKTIFGGAPYVGVSESPQAVAFNRDRGYQAHPFTDDGMEKGLYVPSASTVGRVAEAMPTNILDKWKTNIMCSVVSRMVEQIFSGENDYKKNQFLFERELKNEVGVALDRPAGLGSIVHDFTALHDLGRDTSRKQTFVDEFGLGNLVDAWYSFVTDWKPVFIGVERTLYVRDKDGETVSAGTADRIIVLEKDVTVGGHTISAGSNIILDIKTKVGKTVDKVKPSVANFAQVQLLARADRILIEEEKTLKNLEPAKGVLLVYLCEDGYVCYMMSVEDDTVEKLWTPLIDSAITILSLQNNMNTFDFGVMVEKP